MTSIIEMTSKIKEDNLTIKDDLKIVKDHTALPFTAIAVIFL